MIRVADIRVEWPNIKDRMIDLCQTDRPEDVYADCKHGKASLIMLGEAFAVIRLETGYHDGEKRIFVWKLSAPHAMKDCAEEFYDFCRNEGASSVEMSSFRAWTKVEGWEQMETYYRRKL